MNLLYIHTHDSGRILSPYGYAVPTPGLLDFAKDALLFRQAYCAGPTCSPSRATLLTGMYPHSNGMLGLSQRGFEITNYDWHLVNHLKEYGYHTVLCGIQHEAGSYLNHAEGASVIGYHEDVSGDNTGVDQEDLVQWDFENATQVSKWLRERGREKQFFISYGMYATHRRYPKEFDFSINPRYVVPPYPMADIPENREDYAQYLTSASWFDKCFKLVIDTLKEVNLYDDTIIIYTTDHGIALPYSKCTLYDSGIAVALIMRVPGANSNGHVSDSLVSQVDMFPTLCDLLNLPKADRLQGISFAHLFNMPSAKHREGIFAEINFHTSYEPVRCIRTHRYKYICYLDDDYLGINFSNIDESEPKSFLLKNGLFDQTKPKEALYDLYYDPGERCNLIDNAAYQNILKDLRIGLKNWQQTTSDPILDGPIRIQPNWKVNKKTCLNPGSKDLNDYENMRD